MPLHDNNVLVWQERPSNILVIKRPGESIEKPFAHLINYIINVWNLNAYVEDSELTQEYLKNMKEIFSNQKFDPRIKKFSPKDKSIIDLIVSLGGDGTLIYVSSLFQTFCPPVISFNFGSLGFLCPFNFEDYDIYLNWSLKGGLPLVYRSRLSCTLEPQLDKSAYFEYLALNEVVVNRGSNYCLTNLDIYVNDNFLTSIQSDGLVVSTPTGSTAYAMSTGASLCHPGVEALTISSICPHTLTFRPLVLPNNAEIKICLNPESRGSAFCSIDGKNIGEFKGDCVLKVKGSEYPIPTVCRHDESKDWFEGLKNSLNWNLRPKQKPFDLNLNQKSPFLNKTSSVVDFKSGFFKISSVDHGYISQRSDDSDYQDN